MQFESVNLDIDDYFLVFTVGTLTPANNIAPSRVTCVSMRYRTIVLIFTSCIPASYSPQIVKVKEEKVIVFYTCY